MPPHDQPHFVDGQTNTDSLGWLENLLKVVYLQNRSAYVFLQTISLSMLLGCPPTSMNLLLEEAGHVSLGTIASPNTLVPGGRLQRALWLLEPHTPKAHTLECGYEVHLACSILHTTSPLSFMSSLTFKGTWTESVRRLTPGSKAGSELWASRSALRAQSWPALHSHRM